MGFRSNIFGIKRRAKRRMPLNKVANLGQGENTDACLSPSRRWRAAEESEGRMIEIEVGYWEG